MHRVSCGERSPGLERSDARPLHSGWSPNGLKGLQAGDLLQLHLHIPGESKPLSVRLATIRWAHESRVGVDPILMDADDQLRLNAFTDAQGMCSPSTQDRSEQIIIFDGE